MHMLLNPATLASTFWLTHAFNIKSPPTPSTPLGAAELGEHMTLAELLRRSAEYARRSIEELARALNPPAKHGTPSFEPAYAPRGNRHFRPKHHGSAGGLGRRFFHWSRHCEARMRRPHASLFGHIHRRGDKFFRPNNIRNKHGNCSGPRLFFLLLKAFKTTKITLTCAFRPSLCAGRTRSGAMPNLLMRAGVSGMKWSPCNSDIWQLRFSSLYGPRTTPDHSPYEVLKQSILTKEEESAADGDVALRRYEDQFRSKQAMGTEIREKLRSLAVYQQSIWNFLFPPASSNPRGQSLLSTYKSKAEHAEAMQIPEHEDEDYKASRSNIVSAAVDFIVAPRLALPVAGELNEEMLNSVRDAINTQIMNLQAVLADVNRISELGELPVSIEQNGTVLRVHMPNCDAGRANVLVDEKEVTHGHTVEIVAPHIHVPGTDLLSTSSSEFEVLNDSASEASDEVWQHVRDDTPELTCTESSHSHSSPSLITLN